MQMTAVGIQWGFTGEGRYAHGGLLRAAQAMRLELHEAQVLQHVYDARRCEDVGEGADRKAELRVPLVSSEPHVGYPSNHCFFPRCLHLQQQEHSIYIYPFTVIVGSTIRALRAGGDRTQSRSRSSCLADHAAER